MSIMNRSQFLAVLSQYGATLDTDCENYDLNVDAPAGRVFEDNGCHTICEPFKNNGGQSWKPEAYSKAALRVAMGTYDCPDPDCDVCHGEEA
jgi:hypothetical protein